MERLENVFPTASISQQCKPRTLYLSLLHSTKLGYTSYSQYLLKKSI